MTTLTVGALLPLTGIPFVDGGRSREGADCYGLCLLAHEVLGIQSGDPWRAHAAALRAGCRDVAGWRRIPVKQSELQIGDLLLIETRGALTHADCYAGDGYVLRVRGSARAPKRSELIEFRRVAHQVSEAWRWVGT